MKYKYYLRDTTSPRKLENLRFLCSGREVILDVFNQLNDTDTVRRIVANERTMAGLAEYSLKMTSV